MVCRCVQELLVWDEGCNLSGFSAQGLQARRQIGVAEVSIQLAGADFMFTELIEEGVVVDWIGLAATWRHSNGAPQP